MPKNAKLAEFESMTDEDFENLTPERLEEYNRLVDKELRKWPHKSTSAKDDALYTEAFNELFGSKSGGLS